MHWACGEAEERRCGEEDGHAPYLIVEGGGILDCGWESGFLMAPRYRDATITVTDHLHCEHYLSGRSPSITRATGRVVEECSTTERGLWGCSMAQMSRRPPVYMRV